MAIEKIKEVNIFLSKKIFNDFFTFLKLQEKVEIEEIKDIDGLNFFKDMDIEKYDKIISEIDFLLNQFNRFQKKKSFIKDFIPERIDMEYQNLESLVNNFDFESLYKKIFGLVRKNEKIIDDIKSIKKEIEKIIPFTNLEYEIEKIDTLKKLKIVIGSLKKSSFEKLTKENERCEPLIISEDSINYYLIVAFKREDTSFYEFLKNIEFIEYDFKDLKGKPKEIYQNLISKINELQKISNEIESEINKESKNLNNLKILKEYYIDKKNEEETKQKVIESKFLIYIRGYIKEKDIKIFEQKIKENFDKAYILYKEPEDLDKTPVSLNNNKFFKPFEMLVNMYGYPKYSDFDPTPFLAPFFILFFSLCFGDVIYGLLIVLGSLFLIKKFNVHEKDRNFFYFFIILGLFSIIVGILTNSWAGDLISFPKLAIINLFEEKPGETPGLIKMLIFSLAVGFITQIFAILLKAFDNIRKKKVLDAIFDQISWVISLIGIVLYILFSKNPSLSKIGLYLFIAGIIIIILTGGRTSKSIIGKIIGGVVSLYGIVSSYGFSSALGDILSYSRLLALGFSTTVLGIIINTIARMFGKGIIGILIIPLILLAGHGLNIFMGLLGSFVHPTRLIFLEFFGRFYENGGKKFSPFKFKSEKIIIKNQ
ncbi:MAG: V-type ATP synthase subunit I [Caldisericia bacterium]